MLAALSQEFSGFSKCFFTKSKFINDFRKSTRKLGYVSGLISSNSVLFSLNPLNIWLFVSDDLSKSLSK